MVDRPIATEADDEYWLKVTAPTGPLIDGVIVSINQELGTGYVLENDTGTIYLLTRRVLNQAFDQLIPHMSIKFRENGRRAVVVLQ